MMTTMNRAVVLALGFALSLVMSVPLRADADDPHVRWDDVIGIIQAGNLVGSVTGGGQPWSTTRGFANVNLATGEVHFRVNGLVLAGGNSIGTPDGISEVKGTFVCDPGSGATSVLVDTPLVVLSAQGDASFDGTVNLPAVCLAKPDIAFLIRIGAGRWIANGAVRTP